jgi:hypothetical protein
MSKNFNMVNGYYDKGLWDIDRVRNVVGKSTGITDAEYQEITGQSFNMPVPVAEPAAETVEEPV